ncbi:MAG: signal peptidase I [Planctomycetes bacterium]|nr:signal peptidase I [Planctomycetota bacterium]
MALSEVDQSVALNSRHPAAARAKAEATDRPAVGVRHLMDFLVCLALWVIVVRGFGIEGYIISTGSMAPHLLGYHKRVVCPSCQKVFAVGVPPGSSPSELRRATCPNCGQRWIDISKVPINAGDQLLVHKNAYTFRPPRRWDMVVFRNPEQPTQAYVKRVVGLPGERVQIVAGDVVINGHVQRKNLIQQRATRILVYDDTYRPAAASDWQPRWNPDSGWRAVSGGFETRPEGRRSGRTGAATFRWLSYRHWVRSGGVHPTAVTVRPWPAEVVAAADALAFGGPSHAAGEIDATAQQIRCRGVLTRSARRWFLSLSDAPHWRRAVEQLERESHLAPITDAYAYDGPAGQTGVNLVRDLMIAAQVTVHSGQGQLVFRMLDGRHVYDAVLGFQSGMLRVFVDGKERAVAERRLPAIAFDRPWLVEMSTFDRQIVFAIDGREVLSYVPDDTEAATADGALETAPTYRNPRFALSRPVHIAAKGLAVRIERLRLYRDVYYTAGESRRAVDRPYQLGPDQYFFLGDNSPVSLDSRSWSNARVTRQMFVGKPLVLHLPSRPAKIRIGRYVGHIRIPDFTRIRYIR